MKRLSFCILLVFICSSIFAQSTLDRKKNSFGISLEANVSKANIELTNTFLPIYDGTIVAAASKPKPGFGLGIFYQYRINDKFGIKTQANLSFLETEFEFELQGSNDLKFSRVGEQVYVELPISLIYEDLGKKIGPTFMIGGKLGHELTDDSDNPIFNMGSERDIDFGFEAGIGVAVVFENFVFRPELIYGHWLTGYESYAGVPNTAIENQRQQHVAIRLSFYGL